MAPARPWAFAILGASCTVCAIGLAVRIYTVVTQPQDPKRDLAQMATVSALILVTICLGWRLSIVTARRRAELNGPRSLARETEGCGFNARRWKGLGYAVGAVAGLLALTLGTLAFAGKAPSMTEFVFLVALDLFLAFLATVVLAVTRVVATVSTYRQGVGDTVDRLSQALQETSSNVRRIG